ncbi:dTDP-glucose 4,6-dehydratase [Nocardioides szechwanensis]|uniref:NDP-sugar epimerase, includes UDP-GlcNAc-inverting 4,6-dehydratase FlaA1 and capsular polysaccharide biosynthesis protein EpsC n=1 Tax=Nocardioides szechwanensis TaxID=1005944 RepID=A0A1H0BN89_9ACTN|nr:nucleoside-diphosphate sugar epimerase/dehydratase [Nocardioides szechwanensis]GEP33665.1 dTDP-glucose 4,6-dehydratase [Nocardioides szechwanensis]SDN47035.1 NDP-sugar epimerase, includes UDP-GlcNAc-inverting 4,6-dehydratase FlaA1 and capsular polysaccharide biosynthesis protein EpsC [Nocardioides szechwanensis]
MSNVVALARRFRVLLAAGLDVAAWMFAYLAFAWLRFDTETVGVPWVTVTAVGAGTALLFLGLASFVRLHQGRARVASLEEMLLLGVCVASSGGLVATVNLFAHWVPRTVPAGATLLALVVMAYARASWRRFNEFDDERFSDDGSTRVLVVGAGEAGRELISSMLRDPQRAWRPVAILDDDHRKRHLRIRQIPVVGTTERLAEKAVEHRVGTVVLALPSASSATINRLRLAALDANLAVKVLPASTQLLSEHVGIRDLRDINLTDVLGRNQLDTDIGSIAKYLTGRRVLVTGAGGSIGSELCRQIHRFAPAELMMLDRDESALHALQLSIHGRALLDSDEVILCDIRDRAAVNSIFAARRPDVVFHAAALKHLPMLEQYPAEAVKTNIVGTANVLDAADLVGVDRFVNISTDKAANPCSVLGYSKRISECLTATKAQDAQGAFLSVRFGNVLGSRGSVLTSFAKQIADGGPVTVTDPDVTRYFMTIEEACQLVIQAAAIGGPGEALVLDMGEPVRIVDVAHQLIDQSGTRVEIEFTGLREGEKMHEELFGDDEPQDIRPVHQLVSHVPVPLMSLDCVAALPVTGSVDTVRAAMAQLCRSAQVPGSAAGFQPAK